MKLSSCAIHLAIIGTANAFTASSSPVRAKPVIRRSVLAESVEVEKVNGAKPKEMDSTGTTGQISQPTFVAVTDKTVEKVSNVASPPPSQTPSDHTKAGNVLLPGRYESINYSIALPFLPRPVQLDGSHAGDNGFDPLGFTEDYDIYYMQECELRHARLAMLAVVGWPVSELLGPEALLQDDRAPSVLNGFSVYTGVATLLAFSALALFELNTWNRRTVGTPMGNTHIQDMKNIWHIGVAGDYNFDPAGLYNSLGDDPVGRKAMRSMEITQGRWAMLAITYFAWYEAISGKPVVADNMFFHPNAILPALGVAYLIGSSLYEVSDPKQYPIKIQKSKLGKELDEWTERRKQGEEGRA